MFTPTQLKHYRATYNRLNDDVDKAFAAFENLSDHKKIIRGALKIINQHDADKFLGLFLLHRHFSCRPKKVFVERRYTPRKDHPAVLVTQEEPMSNIPKRIAAHRFVFDEQGRAQPLEFTTDITAGTASKQFLIKKKLAEELGQYLENKRMRSTLGVGIFVRTGSLGRATRVLLEETNFKNRTSVVHLLPTLPAARGRAIPTLWTFGLNQYGCCTGQCVAYCSGHESTGIGYCGHRRSGAHMICV